jgi:hypothetical protein
VPPALEQRIPVVVESPGGKSETKHESLETLLGAPRKLALPPDPTLTVVAKKCGEPVTGTGAAVTVAFTKSKPKDEVWAVPCPSGKPATCRKATLREGVAGFSHAVAGRADVEVALDPGTARTTVTLERGKDVRATLDLGCSQPPTACSPRVRSAVYEVLANLNEKGTFGVVVDAQGNVTRGGSRLGSITPSPDAHCHATVKYP